MYKEPVWRLVLAERAEILQLLRSLEPSQWDAMSLCAGWRVRDVAAHLLVDDMFREMGVRGAFARLATGRSDVDRVNAWWVARNAEVPTDELVDRFADSLDPGRVSRLMGAPNQLRAAVIHHQDIRRPLGLARTIPADRLTAVLDAVLTPSGSAGMGSRARARALRLHATDLSWCSGDGLQVSGPAEALLMALAGRSVALAELHGPGLATLAERMQHRPD